MTFVPNNTTSASVNITGGTVDSVTLGGTTPVPLSVKSLTNTGSAIDAVRVITSGTTVTQLATDHILIISKPNGSPTTVNLLSNPTVGLRLIVKDGIGDANVNPIKIVPSSNIDGSPAINIGFSYGCVELCNLGSSWTIISSIGTPSSVVISPPSITESTEGTSVTAAGTNIYASKTPGTVAPTSGPFDIYALTASPGQILINGAADPATANVTRLVYHNNSVYQLITSGSWFNRTVVTTTSTNLIHNSTNVGAVIGVGTNGILPNTWGSDLNGLVRSVIAFGTDTTTGSSLPYVDVQLNGTTTGTGGDILFDGNIAVSASTQYTLTAYVELISGALTNITFPSLLWNENNSSNSYVATVSAGFTPTGTLVRYSLTGTTSATTATLQPQFNMSMNASSAVNATFRIAAVQLTKGATATTFVPTPSASAVWSAASSPLPVLPTINIGTQANKPVGSAFTVNGTLGGYGSTTPTLNYRDNAGSWLPLPSPVVSSTTYSFLHPAVSSASTMTIGVRDVGNTAINTVSNSFQIYTPGVVTITDITLSNTTFIGGSNGGTVIGTVGVTVTGGTFTGTLSLGGVNAASFILVGSTLECGASQPAAGTYNITLTATMSNASGSPFTKAFVITGTVVSTVPVPPAAQSAGFNRLVMNDDFTTSASVAPNATATSGYNWYWWEDLSGSKISVNFTQTAAQVSNGNSGGGAFASPAGGILQINTGGLLAMQTIPPRQGSFPGITSTNVPGVWQHFYCEAYMQFTSNGVSSDHWPSFWSWSVEDEIWKNQGSVGSEPNHTEIDFMEYSAPPGYGTTIWNWNAGDHTNPNGPSISSSNSTIWPMDSNWHLYGCLWTSTGAGTGRVKFFRDNVQCTYPGNARATGDTSGTGSATAVALETMHQYFALGAGQGWPVYVDYVRVWQA